MKTHITVYSRDCILLNRKIEQENMIKCDFTNKKKGIKCNVFKKYPYMYNL